MRKMLIAFVGALALAGCAVSGPAAVPTDPSKLPVPLYPANFSQCFAKAAGSCLLQNCYAQAAIACAPQALVPTLTPAKQ